MLHHYAGLPVATIAEVVGVPVGTVKSRLHHATRSLRAAIAVDSTLEHSGDLVGMSAPRDPDVILAAWLDDGPADLPSSTRRAISTAVRTTPQSRAGLGLPAWRPTMSKFLALAGAAAVVAVAVGAFVDLHASAHRRPSAGP